MGCGRVRVREMGADQLLLRGVWTMSNSCGTGCATGSRSMRNGISMRRCGHSRHRWGLSPGACRCGASARAGQLLASGHDQPQRLLLFRPGSAALPDGARTRAPAHMNHSVRFWADVARQEPDWKMLDANCCRAGAACPPGCSDERCAPEPPDASTQVDLSDEGVHWDLGSSLSYSEYLRLDRLLDAQSRCRRAR